MSSRYFAMLKLNQLPKEEYEMLKRFVGRYRITGNPALAYSDVFAILIRLADDLGDMQNGVITSGEEYIRRHVVDYYQGKEM